MTHTTERPQRIELGNSGYYVKDGMIWRDRSNADQHNKDDTVIAYAAENINLTVFAAALNGMQPDVTGCWVRVEEATPDMKDGREMLCSEQSWTTRAGHQMGGHRYIARFVPDKVYIGKWITSSGFVQPTHLMFLPAALTKAAQGGKQTQAEEK